MVNPPAPPEVSKPHISDIGLPPQVFSPGAQDQESNYASPILARSSQYSSSMGSMGSLSYPHSRKQMLGTSSLAKLISGDSSLAGSELQISNV